MAPASAMSLHLMLVMLHYILPSVLSFNPILPQCLIGMSHLTIEQQKEKSA
jgi:hypothetical protein